ncbi:hypothetical protein AJ80_03142 [Polytolypa hystricis UAMH7299]|uniref:FAD-dependent oxidoreductase 2 FAD-binding domain-containing protein n=1 Tax=Polytolypa hystricis (strain UAMH7299) TaxID=1447883 RepID=A0A2B7YL49_POLH7|nr:hypothetical protein AJ80_03142 [Polytolypa hystricis UAMH7299]
MNICLSTRLPFCIRISVQKPTSSAAIFRQGTRRRCFANEVRPAQCDETTDVLIVGSGGAGLSAALRAHSHGLNPLIIEKLSKVGGTTAYSGGCLWIPGNHVSKAAGVKDNLEDALGYLNKLIGDVGPASSMERRVAYLENGPKLVSFLENQGFVWNSCTMYPDYHPDIPGGMAGGRSIDTGVFDLRKLGKWQQHLLSNPDMPTIPMQADEAGLLTLFRTSPEAFWNLVRFAISRIILPRLLGKQPCTMGKGLAAQLLHLNIQRETKIYRDTSLVSLLEENGSVIGAVVNRDGQEISIRARRGVLLTAGGFARNREMRQKYQQKEVNSDWSLVAPGDTGDAVRAGMEIGAATALMEDSWWTPIFKHPESEIGTFCLAERSLPHSILVDSSGQRFTNEAESYNDLGHNQFARHAKVDAVPAWMIADSTFRKKYFFAGLPPGNTPQKAISSGFIKKADSVEELARRINVNPKGLLSTVERFNQMARTGIDEDFGRGSNAYENFYGDPLVKPNPNLGPIEKPPFYAARLYPGDIGTKGGLLTDEYARVVHQNGKPIPGLYAAGNTTASVMGHRYPGAGGTLGPAFTFAYIAVNHIFEKSSR